MASKQTRKENKTSPAKIAANKRYNDSKTDVLQCRVKKSENINQRIDDAIRGTDISKAAFILDAIRAKLDNPQLVQAPQPQPDTTPATAPAAVPEGYTLIPCRPDQEPLKVLLPKSEHYNERIVTIVKAGYAPSRAMYVIQALNDKLNHDEALEKAKMDRYYAGYDG